MKVCHVCKCRYSHLHNALYHAHVLQQVVSANRYIIALLMSTPPLLLSYLLSEYPTLGVSEPMVYGICHALPRDVIVGWLVVLGLAAL